MSGAGNPLNYDYRDPRHVERYGKLVVRNPDGSTEGRHPRDADVDVMREIHEPAPLLRVIRAKCLDCSAGVESEIRKCTAVGCALWPYRMATNPFRAPREMTPEQREAGAARLAAARARGRSPSEGAVSVAEHGNYQGRNERTDPAAVGVSDAPQSVPEAAERPNPSSPGTECTARRFAAREPAIGQALT
jgi:hypothetical protein